MRGKSIKDCILSKCKPGASSKELFDAVGRLWIINVDHKEILFWKKMIE